MSITKNTNAEKPKWTKCLFLPYFFCFCFQLYPYPENQHKKKLLDAVNAESVVAKVAAIIPNRKIQWQELLISDLMQFQETTNQFLVCL